MLSLKGSQLTSLNGYDGKKGKQLDISHNLLNDLDGIASWSGDIKWLNASHNNIKGVKHLKTCTNINVLNLSHNQLSSVKSLSKLKGLNALILNNNQLKNLDGVSSLTELNTIVLSSNQLEQIDVVGSLKKLQKFSASHNKLKHFPPLHALKELKDLKLNGNEISIVPDWFVTSCIRIKTLDLGNNRFKDFDSVRLLSSLPYLDNLNLKGNPVCDLENYHLKMREMFPKLKLLDFKKLSDLFYSALSETSQKKDVDSASKKLESETPEHTQVLADRDKSDVCRIDDVEESDPDIRKEECSIATSQQSEVAPKEKEFKSSKKMKRKGENVINDENQASDIPNAGTSNGIDEGPIKKKPKKKKSKKETIPDSQSSKGNNADLLVSAEDVTNNNPKCVDTSLQLEKTSTSTTTATERGFKSKKMKRKSENDVAEQYTVDGQGSKVDRTSQLTVDKDDSIKKKRKRKRTNGKSDRVATMIRTSNANDGTEENVLPSEGKSKTKKGAKKSSKTTGIVNIIKAPSEKKGKNAFDPTTLIDSNNLFGMGEGGW